MSPVIKIENLWKEYRLGVIGHGTLTHDLQSWWAKKRGKDDPNAKIAPMLAGQEKQIDGDHFWALRDINLEVKQGEILGIIGKNGAGKSTLLKILSRVTAPTKGNINVKGRIASLLEVGTGFHPELTGRENVFMNGAILGMSKQEINSKLDEIIEFSGVEDFVDTPVKRYSSGMYVRLAFAVAAHLDPEILIIDEVLAVGDAEFQDKCLGKMKDVSRAGRTVLLVSHNMSSINSLCSRVVWVDRGAIGKCGSPNKIISQYLSRDVLKAEMLWDKKNNDQAECSVLTIKRVAVENEQGNVCYDFYPDEQIRFTVEYTVNTRLDGARLNLTVMTKQGLNVFVVTDWETQAGSRFEGKYLASCLVPGDLFNTMEYILYLSVDQPGAAVLVKSRPCVEFNVLHFRDNKRRFPDKLGGVVAPLVRWNSQELTK